MKTDEHGVHDLGGRQGFGAVRRDGEEKNFHRRWEASVFAMASVGQVTSAWNNVDRFRHAVERIDPDAYLKHGYYGRWLGGIETLLVEAGVISQEELNQRCLELGAPQENSVARMICDITDSDGNPIKFDSRYILSENLSKAAKLGFNFYVGTEIEFFYLNGIDNPIPIDNDGYFDQSPTRSKISSNSDLTSCISS